MTQRNHYLIGELPGFTPQIARLVSMMNYARATTLQAVAGLGVDELDYLHDPHSNSIGALLLHVAATEVGWLRSRATKRSEYRAGTIETA